ncbi:MAG: type II toxin-antitoxin system VapC family toxin [Steroidobacteraceae bacterium]
MILLDSNVVSEMMKPQPAARVISWMKREPASNLYVTRITQAEIFHGVMSLPQGRRRRALEAAAEAMFAEDFADRVLVFGSEAALAYAHIVVERRRRGRPIAAFDAQSAAIARASGATLATRNLADFDYCAVKVVNPWK